MNLTQKLISEHLVEGNMEPGREIGMRIDQTLTQDATGTMVMLELEAMGLERVKTELSAQYVDHNLLQVDYRNPDDHLFLETACRRFGVWYSRPGNGVSHPVHMQRFGKPGSTLLGSDSHTPAAGAIGMFAVGAGGLEVALAMAGQPFYFKMPEVWGVRLDGEPPDWVSAKDVILEMLRRHGVDGAVGCVLEYYGPGLACLSAMDRHVIANMGTELGATSTVFPSDDEVRRFLRWQGREENWQEFLSDDASQYQRHDEIELSKLEPLIAKPSSPGNVVPVKEVAGRPIYQSYVGSSANPGYRDFAVAALIVHGRHIAEDVSFDINPASRQILLDLIRDGHLGSLIQAGARLHQAGCNGCIGMGQAPATNQISLRTVPRNFPGRSGTREDQVYLVSPETAAASALTGTITDPRDLDMDYPKVQDPDRLKTNGDLLVPPLVPEQSAEVELRKGPNIVSLPDLASPPQTLELPVLLKVGDDISTDEIMPAGARILPYRSNVPKISQYCFEAIDDTYPRRAEEVRDQRGHVIVGGNNYGQGSSREHAALAPRYLGLRLVLAKSFARIHWQNLVNFGVLPLTFCDHKDYERIQPGDALRLTDLRQQVTAGQEITIEMNSGTKSLRAHHGLSARQVDVFLSGGLVNWMKARV
jgi:aconitate hydratase